MFQAPDGKIEPSSGSVGTGRGRILPVGFYGGSGHQKSLFFQDCAKGRGNSSKGNESPIRKESRNDRYLSELVKREKIIINPQKEEELFKTGLFPQVKKEKIT
jgi:hypothetical protein